MAGTIPFSNPSGNNQTNPTNSLVPGMSGSVAMPIPGSPVQSGTNPAQQNPFITASSVTGANPASSGTVPAPGQTTSKDGSTPNTAAQNGFITNNSSYSNGQNDLQKQLTDIYGKGTGGSLFSLLNNMSGTNSTILQEFIQSLVPQEAKASADVNASLGAEGVGANSSVNAIAQSNLKSQEFAAISGESANLTQNQEQLTAQILEGTSGASAKETASSGWQVFGDVLNSVATDAGSIMKAFGV